MSSLNDLLWAAGVMMFGVLGMVLNYGDPMFWYAVLVLAGGAIWALLIRVRMATVGRDR